MPLSLDKWYLDAVADDGRAVIAYRIELRAAGLTLRAGSVLERSADGTLSQRSCWRQIPSITDHNGHQWDVPALEFRAAWEPSLPFHRTLFESAGRTLNWSCLAPNTPAAVHSRGHDWSGRGYVERLTTTITPWKLPIDCLWWGRFSGERSSLVWIRWDGPYPLTLILLDGQEVNGQVHERGLQTDNGLDLSIDPAATLRDSDVAQTFLSELPLARRFASRARWGLREQKWLGRGTLQHPGSPPDVGWVIHERVCFDTRRPASSASDLSIESQA